MTKGISKGYFHKWNNFKCYLGVKISYEDRIDFGFTSHDIFAKKEHLYNKSTFKIPIIHAIKQFYTFDVMPFYFAFLLFVDGLQIPSIQAGVFGFTAFDALKKK